MLKPALILAAAFVGVRAWTSPAPAESRVQQIRVDSVPNPTAPGSAEPFLAKAANGTVYMSWLEPASPGYSLKFSTFDGTKWAPARTIVTREDFFVNWADFPSIKPLNGNRLAAHWLQRVGKGTYAYGVRIALSNDGGATWGTPLTPHRDTTQTEHGFVTLWNEGGTLGAAWLDGRNTGAGSHDAGGHGGGGSMTLMTTTVGANGKALPETLLDNRTCDCCQNAAAITSNGPVVVYRDRSPDEIRDIYITRRVAGKWVTGAPVARDNWKIPACPVNGPAIAAQNNRVAVAWFAAPGDSARVQLAFSDDAGAKFGAPVRIDGGKPAGRVDVALLADGGALVTWIERMNGDTASVRTRRVSRTGVAGAPSTIATSSSARASGFPRMVITGNDVLYAWTVPGKPSQLRTARVALASIK
ncbi:MAG: exo-alpha-sialidase [Gemmatimonas sp.]